MRRLVGFLIALVMVGLAAPALAQPIAMKVEVCGPAERQDCRAVASPDVDPQGRELWLHGQVELSAANLKFPVGMSISGASSELYWNGERVGSNGVPAGSKAAERPGNIDYVTLIPRPLLRPGVNSFRVHLSGFHAVGRFKHPLSVSVMSYAPASGAFGRGQWWRLRFYVPALLALGALTVSITYFGALWAMDRTDRGSGLLALLCVAAMGQLLTEIYRGMVGYIYPHHFARVTLIAVFAGLFGILLTAFVAERFAPTVRRRATAATAILAVGGAFLIPGYDIKALLCFVVASLIAGFLAARATWERRPGALVALIGIGVFLATLFVRPMAFLDEGYYLALSGLMLMLFVVQVIALRRREREAEALRTQATRLELELLKRQLTPHVMLNTLTSLTEWIESDPKSGVRMIDALAAELRALSSVSAKPLISVAEEIELCRAHLALMSIQRDTPFSMRTEDVDPEAMIPPAVFHTVIENALTHNRYRTGGVFHLRRTQNRYEITSPPGDGLEVKGEGQGTAYIKGRLSEAFGQKWRFSSEASGDGGWTTVIEAPA